MKGFGIIIALAALYLVSRQAKAQSAPGSPTSPSDPAKNSLAKLGHSGSVDVPDICVASASEEGAFNFFNIITDPTFQGSGGYADVATPAMISPSYLGMRMCAFKGSRTAQINYAGNVNAFLQGQRLTSNNPTGAPCPACSEFNSNPQSV